MKPRAPEEPISAARNIDLIRLERYGLLPLVNETTEGSSTDQIRPCGGSLVESGFIMPQVRIQDNLQLPPIPHKPGEEIEVGRGDIRPNRLMVMDPGGNPIDLAGTETHEPTFIRLPCG